MPGLGVPCPWVEEGDSEVQGIMGNGHMGPTPTTKTDTYETLHFRKRNAGFLVGGGQPSRGHQHTILRNIPKNCMKLSKFWAVWGGLLVHGVPP